MVQLALVHDKLQSLELNECQSPINQYLGLAPSFIDSPDSPDADLPQSMAMRTACPPTFFCEVSEPCGVFSSNIEVPYFDTDAQQAACSNRTYWASPYVLPFVSVPAGTDSETADEDHPGDDVFQASALRRRRQKQAGKSNEKETKVCKVAFGPTRFATCWYDRQTAQLLAGEAAQSSSLAELRGRVRQCTLDGAGCRVVQKAIEECGHEEIIDLVAELHGFVRRAIASPHGNYVIQKVVKELPVTQSAFVAQELCGFSAGVARTKYGCRVMCRLVEHGSHAPATKILLDELLRETANLCWHPFGHHVMEAVLEHGTPDQKQKITEVLCAAMPDYARNRSSSYVVESALKHSAADCQYALASAVVNDPEGLVALAEHESGFRVVRAILGAPSEISARARKMIQQNSWQLKKSQYGNHVLTELKLKFHSVTAAA